MVEVGLIVRLEARAGKEDELSAFLRGALPLVEDEPQTIVWLGVQAGPSSFDLLARPPDLERVDVLAAKLGTGEQE